MNGTAHVEKVVPGRSVHVLDVNEPVGTTENATVPIGKLPPRVPELDTFAEQWIDAPGEAADGVQITPTRVARVTVELPQPLINPVSATTTTKVDAIR